MIGITIDVDHSQLDDFARKLEKGHLEQAITRGIHRTADEAPGIIKKDIEKRYHGGEGFIDSAVKAPIKQPMGAVIPLRGTKGGIGTTFRAGAFTGGSKKGADKGKGWKLRYKGRVAAHIVKGKQSALPSKMTRQGGNAPFMLYSSAQVVTRRTKKRFPLVRVVGLAVPQMAATRAKEDIQNHVGKELLKNVTNELEKELNI